MAIKQLEFSCPKCGNTELEEHMSDVNVYSIVEVYDDGSIDTSRDDIRDGNIATYGCSRCSFRIYDRHENVNFPITDPDELVAWLKGQAVA